LELDACFIKIVFLVYADILFWNYTASKGNGSTKTSEPEASTSEISIAKQLPIGGEASSPALPAGT
jgi:hypothetical protein